MTDESRILDLIVRWEECRAEGRDVPAEELCRDCPELLESLQRSLEAVAGVDAVLQSKEMCSGAASTGTHVLAAPARAAGRKPRDLWPELPEYEILQEVGRGGMGVVYKARQVALDRIVAIKTILACEATCEQQRERFEREARAMALVQHPNIVQIHEIGYQGDYPFLVMEYVRGESLSARLERRPMPPRKAAELLATLARAVHAAHEHGIIHRDLKPKNILISTEGVPKICDFGLAKQFENPVDCTQMGMVAGTPSYMAPEQVRSDGGGQGPGVDIHALGAVFYETLAGRPPYLADNPIDTLQLVAHQEPVPPRQLQPKTPRDLETICLKCLAKDPRRRYPTALELARDLERFLAGVPIHARPVGRLERGWRWCRTHRSWTAAIAVGALAVVAVLAVALTYNRLLSGELARTDAARRQALAARQQLDTTLTQELANGLDGDLRELAAVPLTLASLLETRRDWDRGQLETALKDLLDKSPRIFGLCAAFEPRQWREDSDDFALYVYRSRGQYAVKELLPPGYRPLYRDWEWYRAAKESPHGRWSEPYVGEGGDRTPMVTFSAPIRRGGRFAGAVTADLAMDYFRDLRARFDRLDLGHNSYCFVVTRGQRILAHYAEGYEFPSPNSDFSRLPIDARLRALADPRRRDAASLHALDPVTGQPATFQSCPVPAARWALITVIADNSAPAPGEP